MRIISDNYLQSPALSDFIKKTNTIPIPDLPAHLSSFPSRWPFPRGDLYHWVQSLNRFDDILHDVIELYNLDNEPQSKKFSLEYLLSQNINEEQPATENDLLQRGYSHDGDRQLVVALLDFSKILLEKCGNRNLYASSDRLNGLLNTTSLPLLNCTLRLGLCVAQRYNVRDRRHRSLIPPQYNIDTLRLEVLCAPISKTTASDGVALLGFSRSKGRSRGSMSSQSLHKYPEPNDFISLAHDRGAEAGVDWEEWLNLDLEYSVPQSTDEVHDGNMNGPSHTHTRTEVQSPTPVRRPSGGPTPQLRRSSNANTAASHGKSGGPDFSAKDEVKKLTLEWSAINQTPIEVVIHANIPKLPRPLHFLFLHKLRTCYGLGASAQQRQMLLATRILAFANLAYIYSDSRFESTVLRDDLQLPKDRQISYQLANLMHVNPHDQNHQPLHLRSVAAIGLRSLARYKNRLPDILTALGANLSHGILLFTIRQVVTSLSTTSDDQNELVEDEWRDSVLSLVHALTFTFPPLRPSELTPAPGLMSAYVEVLNTRTEKARRLYLKVLEFFDALCQIAKDGLSTLANHNAFEAVTGLLNSEVSIALPCHVQGKGFPDHYRTPSIDYDIPYPSQQVIRFLLPFLDKVLGQHGAVADRILRSLIDTPPLLSSLRLIIENGKAFGGHIWACAIKVLGSFLHNEPTSYAVIAEAGLSRAFLETVTGEPLNANSGTKAPTAPQPRDEPTASSSTTTDSDVEMGNDDGSKDPSGDPAAIPSRLPGTGQGIPASTEAISNVAQAFEAICLTSAGFELFQKSSALPAFFSTFESPAHVEVMRSVDFLPHLGNVFDELVRHHPALKDDVLSSILVMVARLRFICRPESTCSCHANRLWLKDENGKIKGADSLRAQDTFNGFQVNDANPEDGNRATRILKLPNGAELSIDRPQNQIKNGNKIEFGKDDKDINVADYVTCVMSFLVGLFENQSFCASFLEAGGAELVLDFAVLPNLPYDFLRNKDGRSHAGPSEIAQVMHLMAESKPHLIIPSVLQHSLRLLGEVEMLVVDPKSSPDFYWRPFLVIDDKSNERLAVDPAAVRATGTDTVTSLTQLNMLVTILQEIFSSPLYHTRQSQQPSPFLQVNAGDLYVDLSTRLGRLQTFCLKEEIFMERIISESWKSASKLYDIGKDAEELERAFDATHNDPVQDPSGIEDTDRPESLVMDSANGSSSGHDTFEQDPGYRNFRTLDYLMKQLPRNISKWFHALAHGLIPRRRMDQWQKQSAFHVADALGSVLSHPLENLCFNLPSEHLSEFSCLAAKYEYCNAVLANLFQVTLGESPGLIIHHPPKCMIAVLIAFRKAGGMRILRELGLSLYSDLTDLTRSHKIEDIVDDDERATLELQISRGLAAILTFCDSISSSKCIVDASQSQSLKTPDRTRPNYFQPGQFLLELRVDVLPLICKIWGDSPDFKQPRVETASNQMLESIIHVLRHILDGDNENDAFKSADLNDQPVVSVKQFPLHTERFTTLIERDFQKSLAHEALYRCNNSLSAAEEYCKSITLWFRASRSPPPSSEPEAKTPELQRSPPPERSSVDAQQEDAPATEQSITLSISPALDHLHQFSVVEAAEDDDESMSEMSVDEASSHHANDITIPNQVEESAPAASTNVPEPRSPTQDHKTHTLEDLNAEREKIRLDLVEQCLNVLSEHPESTFDLSDLLLSATKKLPTDEAVQYRETAGQFVVSMLTSLQSDLETGDDVVSAGKKTASSAHFLALLIQDKNMYDACVEPLKTAFSMLVAFIKPTSLQASHSEDISRPWIAPVLLVIEKMLSDDAEPEQIEWNPPNPDGTSIEDSTGSIVPKEIVSQQDKILLFETILEVLPKVGRESSLALSISRVVVILTRSREIASRLSEKRNLQRLFLMVKQLKVVSNERLMSSLMLIFRHIIEDEKTLLEIMKSEIVANFEGRSSRPTDTTAYTRQMYHLVLRSPDVFVQATNETVMLQQYEVHTRPQNLVLKGEARIDALKPISDSPSAPTRGSPTIRSNDESLAKKEGQGNEPGPLSRTKTAELQTPIVENPDGVIHYLLSELLSHKEVTDNEVQPSEKQPNGATSAAASNGIVPNGDEGSSAPSDTPGTNGNDNQIPQENANFKSEEHPIFTYRCFILQCLTELLHSYNRTKIEFINFSRKQDPLTSTPSKPRGTVLNYLLNGLIPSGTLETSDAVSARKRAVVSDWATKVIVALCSKTGELGTGSARDRYSTVQRITDNDDEADLSFVRRFVLEHAIRAFQNAASSTEALDAKYSKLSGLADLFQKLLAKPAGPEGVCGTSNMSYKVLGKMMFEKNFIQIITSNIADIDLNFPGAKRVVKSILKPLETLTGTALVLSQNSSNPVFPALGQSEQDEISSASSVSDMNEREETPDLFRHSTLGMLEPSRRDESSSDSEDNDDGDEDEGYDDDEYGDEMEYEDEMGPSPVGDGEVVSDEDPDDMGHGPIEGLPGDVPMDIELVMEDDGMDEESEDDEDGEDEDLDDDNDDDDDDDLEDDVDSNEDIEVDEDGAIEAGEINGDDENASLGEVGGEEIWESEEGEIEDEVEGVSHALENLIEPAGPPINVEDPAVGDVQSGLDTLLQIVGDTQAGDGPAPPPWTGTDAAPHVDQGALEDNIEYSEEDDDGDDDQNFDDRNFIFDTGDETPWDWENDDAAPIRGHHHRHRGLHRHFGVPPAAILPTEFLRRHDIDPFSRIMRPPAQPRGPDDGTNPLLRRSGSSAAAQPPGTGPSSMDFFSDVGPSFLNYFANSGHGGGGDVFDALMQAVQRGERTVHVSGNGGQFDIRLESATPQFRGLATLPGQPPSAGPRGVGDDPQRVVNFSPMVTPIRWQEEARLLYGTVYVEKSMRVINSLLKALVPPAIEEEMARQKRLEEERKREAEERAEKDRQEREAKEEVERKRKEEEEREAARRAAEESAAAEAAANAASQGESQLPNPEEQLMQDVQSSDAPPPAEQPEAAEATPSAPVPRVYTTIRGRELDITDMSIDAEYLEALPEELREEVIMQQYAEQRHQAEEHGQAPSEINHEFLNALPEEIRAELLQQEAADRRRRERDAARRRATESGGPARAEEMDTDSFMASLDPALRRSILAEQSDEIIQSLAPQFAAEARSMLSHTLNQFGRARLPLGRGSDDIRRGQEQASSKDTKRQVVQMVDNAGVATVLRLMFMPQQGSAKTSLYAVLRHICEHRQTRIDVINTILAILHDGSADIAAVEKSLSNLSLRAKTSGQKPPPSLKRTLSLPGSQSAVTEATPLTVVQQCLGALENLNLESPHVSSAFLRSDGSSQNKLKPRSKGKGRDDRSGKFAVNALLGLLDRKMITENSACMEPLARLLALITLPLQQLLRKEKEREAPKDSTDSEAKNEATNGDTRPEDATRETRISQTESIQVSEPAAADVPMTDAAHPTEDDHVNAVSQNAPVPSEGNAGEGSSKVESKPDESKEAQESKTKKPFEPPVIPEANLRLVVGIIAARECHAKTFQNTMSTMMNLSLIPGTKGVFGKELVHQAQMLCSMILLDLDNLLPNIRNAQSGPDLHGPAFSKLSGSTSDQYKLLRVLTALDYLFDPKREEINAKYGLEPSKDDEELLPSLYENVEFSKLWAKVGECLTAMRQKENMISAATILQPSIEALMVICKNTSLKDVPAFSRQLTPIVSRNSLETLFFNFTEEHRRILNDLVRQNPKLMSGSFAVLVKNPKVLDFDNKLSYFRKRIRSRDRGHPQPPLQLSIRRNETFMDSYRSLYFKNADEMKYGKLSIRFHGEEGVDAGGVTREWFQVLARGMFNPNYALFIPVASDRTTFHPNRLSGINEEHLRFFKFIGRIIGKALYEGRVLDCHFSRAVYKKILGKNVSIKDMETLDLDYYKSLVWMLENDITDIITENFSVETADFGETQTLDLIENGRHIPVTEENKQEYVQRVVEYRLTDSVKEQLENFLQGFFDIIPAEVISIFNEQELELLISGLPDINIDDWKANTEYHTYTTASPQIQWFWRAVRSFDKEEQAKLLQFVTGTSKVPLNGFKELEGMNGFSKFNIHKDYGNKERLPSSHTCFNRESKSLLLM